MNLRRSLSCIIWKVIFARFLKKKSDKTHTCDLSHHITTWQHLCLVFLLGRDRGRRVGTHRGRRARVAAEMRLRVAVLVLPLVDGASSGVHEEVADGAEFESQLLRDGHLHLLGRPLGLLEDGVQRPPLDVGEDEAWFLHVAVVVVGAGRRLSVFFLLLASCRKDNKKDGKNIIKFDILRKKMNMLRIKCFTREGF